MRFSPTVSRRSLLSALAFGLTTLAAAEQTAAEQAAAEQTTTDSPEPGSGEILLEGIITGGSRKERRMTLRIDSVVPAGGVRKMLNPPRARDVQLTDKTVLVNLANADQPLVPEGLMIDLRVSVIGKDRGIGQILPARLILVDARTLEQRTLLERGQLAVATQTFTRLGDKAWWNFRCSDAAKATLTAYRTGLKMTVDQAARQYDVQFQQGDMAVAEGDVLTVSFRAKADRARALHVEAQATGGDYPDIGLVRDVAPTTQWQPFSWSFAAQKVGKRSQIVFGVGQETGSVWLEAVSVVVTKAARASVGAKTAAVAQSGKTAFGGPLVTQIDLFSLIGKRYDFERGGEQPFTLLLTSEDEPIQLVPITLAAQKETSVLKTDDGMVTVRTLDWRRPLAGERDTRPVGYLMIGPNGEMIKAENTAGFFAEPLYRMQGPATKTKTGFEMQMREPYRDRWRVEKTPAGWKVSVLLANGAVAGFVETDALYQPTRIHCPISGDITARVFSATVADGYIVWDLPPRK